MKMLTFNCQAHFLCSSESQKHLLKCVIAHLFYQNQFDVTNMTFKFELSPFNADQIEVISL